MNSRPPLPPFTKETAIQKVRLAEDGWNTRDPVKVSLAYTVDSHWRNRTEFANGREQIVAFHVNRIAVRFAYEYNDDSGNWFRAYGNENWEFDDQGLMYARHASINELPIVDADRKFHWPLGRRPDEHPGLSDLGL
jgi:nuclear transport factor 2 (NTF2) superfamily protein